MQSCKIPSEKNSCFKLKKAVVYRLRKQMGTKHLASAKDATDTYTPLQS